MNVPSHISGQIPGQMVPSQGISRLPGLSQQNGGGGSLASQLQNMGGVANVEPDFVVARSMMREKITQYIQGRSVPTRWQQNLPDIVKRLEEWLFKHAPSKEEYLNMETFESRLITISKNLNNLNQQMITHRSPSSAPISTMIPTPGMSHGGSSNVIATGSADTSVTTSSSPGTIMATSIGTGNIIQSSNGAAPTGNNGSFNASDANHSIGSMPPMALSYSSSHMIPTPGLNNTQSMSLSSGGNGGGYSGVESTRVQQQQKQFIGNQNSRILQNLGGQIGAGVRNSMQQRYRFPNGGLTYMPNNSQLMNGPVVSEGSLSTTAYHNSPRPSQQQHQSLCTRDSYGVNNLAGIGNLYTNAPSTGSTLNSQNINSLNLQPRSKPNAASQSYQHNLQSIQQTGRKPPLLDNAQKMEFQSTHSAPEAYVQNSQSFQKLQQQQFQSQTSQPYAQFSQNQFQPQQQLLVENDQLRQPFVTSSINRHLMSEQGMNSVSESLLLQDSEEFKFSVLSGFRQNPTVENSSVGSRSVSQLSDSQNMKPSLVQDPQQNHQIYRPNQHSVESQNNLNSLSNGCQPEVLLQGQWPSQAQKSHILDQTSFQSHIQSDFQPQMIGKSAGLQIHNPLDGSGPVASITNGIAMPKQSSFNSHDFGNSFRAQQYYHQRRWLLFLHHARYCGVPKGKCKETYCSVAQDLVLHMGKCDAENCTYRYCKKSKTLLKHFFECKAADCPVCIYVRDFCSKHKPHPLSDAACVQEKSNTWEAVNALDAADKPGCKTSLSSMETSEDIQSAKRLKMDHMSVLGSKGEVYSMPAHETGKHLASQEAPVVTHPLVAPVASANSKVTDIKIESSTNFALENPPVLRPCKIDDSKYISSVRASECQDKLEKMQIDKDFDKPKVETKQEIAVPVDSGSGTKSGKPKIKGVSLTELFTPEQVREHIIGLRQWVGQSRAKAEKNQAMEHSMSDNSCQLCAVEKLTFEPPPIYCSICGTRIKRNAMYYTCGSSDTRQYFCIPCHNDARGDSIEVEGITIPKARLEKKRNDEETEEWWVQCDKCEAWQHQICALFNGRRNEGGQAEYTCPNCYVQEVERGERRPLPQSAVLGADDLPKTLLSDHLEQRLLRRLKQERQERARSLGKSFDEVLGAEALVIRVVSSVDKKLDVKQRFLEIFQDNYPTEFPYKSKVVLLFQKIEGVEVCLFGMYVQEFGSECQFPNQRRVYLSYLDSVKYFRPEIKTVTGEALRTFVYHEILIGYLDYCKKRGFTSCYIWACPPLKGEDYILYCHPEIQKTPKSDKLREWYLSMLRKAIKENIVASLTNLYDHFFVTVGECKAKVTAARLPYFDGDYWPGAAEDMINQLQQEEDGRKQQKKGKTKKTITKRALKAAGQTDLSGNASKDALLMQKLGETICPMKEDFIMVHLQHACSHCCLLMVSGFRWVCNQCKNFQLCEKCYDAEQKREERERHPINSREKHLLKPIEIDGVPSDTKDRDEILESEFFDTRQAFLSLCQGNHYQFDTLRRAKHSSMMVLYHLHNPTAPAFVTTCNICHHDIETGQGWRCETCTDFDVCNSCYKRDGGAVHPHKLTTHPSMMDAQNTEARQKRVAELRKMLNLLVHASKCRASPHQPLQCQYPDCRKVKGLFRHGRICKVRASGGCVLCKRMWYLLQLHARACKESECHVPRCKDLKEHLKRLQQQSDSRRRAAVMEMMRQRAAEVAACS